MYFGSIYNSILDYFDVYDGLDIKHDVAQKL